MWQTDNEYGCHDTVLSNDADACAGFRLWLQKRYETVAVLNEAWGTVFWSQEYRSFDEIDPPLATVTEPTPAHVMDWRRYSSDQVADYNALQTDILRKHAVDIDITHNFMGHFTEFDHYPVAQQLDISTWDSYPLGFLEQAWWDSETKLKYMRTGHPDFAAFHHDLYRGMSKGRFGVMEQQPGPVNWAHYNPAPLDGMVALWTLEALAHGAELVSYFRWRQAPFAQEQMHAGLNRSDNSLDKASIEAEAVARIIKELGPLSKCHQASVALVYDYEAHWAHKIQPQGKSFRHDELSFKFYTALRKYGLDVDIISPDTDGSGYELIVIPSSPMLTSDQLARLSSSGAHILCGPRTGSRTVDFHIPDNLAPGVLQEVLPINVSRSESLRPGYQELAKGYTISRWLEHVDSKLEPTFRLDSGAGIIWGHERVTYLSAWADDDLIFTLVGKVASKAGLIVNALPSASMRLRCRGDLLFVMDYHGLPRDMNRIASVISGYQKLDIPAENTSRGVAIYRKL